MQKISAVLHGEIRELCLPAADNEVMPGIRWGSFDHFFTPAYWASQLWMLSDNPTALTFKLGRTLKEETAACLLGGHGITAEMCLGAYDALREHNLLNRSNVTTQEIASVLKGKLTYGNRSFRYRFPNKKAEFLAPALNALTKDAPAEHDHLAFRNWFLRLPGVGLKTASWITRNWLNSNRVAILDIHVIRCGRLCGIYGPQHSPSRHYIAMEEMFLRFANQIGADAAKLDVLMWKQMRNAGALKFRLQEAA